MQQQNRFRQIAALNLRRVTLRLVQMPALGPKPMTRSRRSSSSTSGALIRGGAANWFQKQSADATLGIISRNSREAAIDDVPNSINRHRSFRDIRRNNYFSQRIWRERKVLVFRLQFSVQRNQRQSFAAANRAARAECRIDLRHPRHEDEDVAFLSRAQNPVNRIGRLISDRTLIVR